MDYRYLGSTGLLVSRLCYGTLTIGPLQAKLSVEEGSELLKEAFDRGINFLDTAELYNNYDYIKHAVKGRRNKVIISAKSYAYSNETAEASLQKAMREIGTDYIDIFSLHEQESEHTIRGHYEALTYFMRAKEKGYIRTLGISTHTVAAVEAALKYPEIQVLHPIINKAGLGILDGKAEDMLKAIERAAQAGKGIYSMKALGGGNLIHSAKECFDFVLGNQNINAVAVGMQSKAEIINNIAVFEGKEASEEIKNQISSKKRRLMIDFWCTGCGSCSEKCQQKAIIVKNGKAEVNPEKCVLCGYCSAYCPDFCIKII
ncbi:MAG: aldo/keto reductase [Clostridia bacterium]|nr:aldo/keto reductase [Clostridia bacterium]